jgi:hypothetical protein
MPDIKFTVSILAGTISNYPFGVRVGSSKGKDPAMHSAEYCRIQSEECRCLVPLARSEAEAAVLRSLSRSWVMIANQSDRYAESRKKRPAQNKVGASWRKIAQNQCTMRFNRAVLSRTTAPSHIEGTDRGYRQDSPTQEGSR